MILQMMGNVITHPVFYAFFIGFCGYGFIFSLVNGSKLNFAQIFFISLVYPIHIFLMIYSIFLGLLRVRVLYGFLCDSNEQISHSDDPPESSEI